MKTPREYNPINNAVELAETIKILIKIKKIPHINILFSSTPKPHSLPKLNHYCYRITR